MKKNDKFKISIPLVLLFCFFIHPVMIKDSMVLSYMYQYGIPFVYVLFHVGSIIKLSKKQGIIYSLLILLVLFSFIYPTIHSTNDYSYVRVSFFVFRKIIVYIFLISVLVKHYKQKCNVECFMYYFSIVQAVYVTGTIIMVFVPKIKNFWFSIFSEVIDSEALLQSYGYTFRIGWQGFSGYEYTIFCTISCLFLLYLYFQKKECNFTRIQLLIPYLLCVLGNMFYGRSGLVVTIFASIIYLLAFNRSNIKNILKIILLLFAFIILVYSLRNVSVFAEWYYWMSKPIINLFTTGKFNNISISTTNDMIFMPEYHTILFGDGYYVKDGHYYMLTDSGIMRSILFWGLLGTTIAYLTTLLSILEAKKKSRLLFMLLLGAFFAFEYKGHIYFDFILIMLAMTYVETLKKYYYG